MRLVGLTSGLLLPVLVATGWDVLSADSASVAPTGPLHFHAEVVVEATRKPSWELWLPDTDPRWPNLVLSIVPSGPAKDVVRVWDIKLEGLGDPNFFYPKTKGFHGPGPMTIGPWLLKRPEAKRVLAVRGQRFSATARVVELEDGRSGGISEDPLAGPDRETLALAKVVLDLVWNSGTPERPQ